MADGGSRVNGEEWASGEKAAKYGRGKYSMSYMSRTPRRGQKAKK